MNNELVIAGGGSGQPEYILPAAMSEIKSADFLIASQRFLDILGIKGIAMKNIAELLETLPEYIQKGKTVIVVSGDPLMYSLCKTILQKYPEMPVRIIPGTGAVQLLGCAFGITMEDAAIMSIHGRDVSAGKIACKVSQNRKTFFYCSKDNGVKEIAESLIEYGLEDTEIFAGAYLTYPEEILFHGKPCELVSCDNPELCVVAVVNPNPKIVTYPPLLRDNDFIRNDSPMTKEEVRAVILSKLYLQPDFTVWDIGAGTGSISVECARMCPYGKVYAIEYKEKAIEILKKNKDYFNLKNMEIIQSRANDVIKELPFPDCIFIGGSDGELADITEKISLIPQKVRVVVSAVTYETQSEGYRLFSSMPAFEVIQIAVSRSKNIGRYRIAEGNNPVTLFIFNTQN